ncbi:sigma-54-dependent transcriptional regulator [Psychrobacillus sp. NPDC093180]|uniref:sigma-54-dependent transcriptional regulator n=1 Tax=Psychrobacillus sp. NPDC093180 TaxID=3364489 RepID=UPI0038148781
MNSRILIIDDETAICVSLSFALEDNYDVITTSNPQEGIEIIEQDNIDLVLLDLKLGIYSGLDMLQEIKKKDSSVTVIMMTAYSSIETSIEAIKQGAYYYIEKPIIIEELQLLISKALEYKGLSSRVETLTEELEQRIGYKNFIGKSKAMYRVFSLIDRIKDIDSNVLIMGESGSGKELVVRNIHNSGKRKNGPLEVVNCAAIPEALLESELFGYEKGAFTGATQRKQGKWVSANGGTLFLDEVSEMPFALQAKLLRVLQEREITPLGSNTKISLDVRIISATNKKLEKMVSEGTFRDDLYFRLNVIPLIVPPLRERKEDLPLLIDYFLQKYCLEMNRNNKHFSKDAYRLLLDYNYPGNVRELENIIEYAVALSKGDYILDNDLPTYIMVQKEDFSTSVTNEEEDGIYIPVGISMKEIEKKMIAATLDYYGWNRQNTAHALQISERGLRNKIKQYEIEE